MFCNIQKKIFRTIFLICLLSFSNSKAQSLTEGGIDMQIRQSSVNGQIVSHIIQITNPSDSIFKGIIRLEPSMGIRPLSYDARSFTVSPHDSSYVSYKLVISKNTSAGSKTIRYDLLSEKKELMLSKETDLEIEEREQIYLTADNNPVMAMHLEDSVHIKVTVNNSGNRDEKVTLVFNVPNLRGAPSFTELKATVAAAEQKQFVYSFIPSGNLLSSGQFSVHITAMKGKDKSIFGNKTVTIQNVASNRSYVDIRPNVPQLSGYGSDDNSVTLSYRQYNSSSNMLQLRGGGYLNLPAGYLQLNGNVYKYSSQQTPMITNTSLMYKLYENEFTVGNVSESAELSLYGRGAKAMFADKKKSKTLTFGAIDQNFNLFGSEPWFSNYYSFYVQGALGANNYQKGIKGSYIYQKNAYEKADYHVGSLQWRTSFGNDWNIDLKTHGALSSYESMRNTRFSGATELTYRGKLSSDLTLNGSGYYSNPYFPGNRRGTISLSQGIGKRLGKEMYISGSVSYNKMNPKYDTYSPQYQSENWYGNAGLSLPQIHRLSPFPLLPISKRELHFLLSRNRSLQPKHTHGFQPLGIAIEMAKPRLKTFPVWNIGGRFL
ncbi:hypothetical protein [Parabacteroides sp. Marseille-P3160]|uniref:COG1470 family protein n=1 Tax=Parabacteroides sp. Marseille-P3160 TaxID=1917887 RepID=UPI0009BA9E6F|nr:hypothetical protein [Parabacteroides sp. Marseille-P3160]